MSKQIKLLGYRQDVRQLLKASDVFLFSSLQEGLPVSVMEAMAAGLPCIVSNIRGNIDLIDEKLGGYLFDRKDIGNLSKLIKKISIDKTIRKKMGLYNQGKILAFDEKNVRKIMNKEYSSLLGEKNGI